MIPASHYLLNTNTLKKEGETYMQLMAAKVTQDNVYERLSD